MLAELGAGEVRLHGGTSGDQKFFVAWGFVEVLPERVTILAETALHPDEIDRAEAQQELEEGEKLWQEAGDDGKKYDEANAVTRRPKRRSLQPKARARASNLYSMKIRGRLPRGGLYIVEAPVKQRSPDQFRGSLCSLDSSSDDFKTFFSSFFAAGAGASAAASACCRSAWMTTRSISSSGAGLPVHISNWRAP